ncbi:MAG TPA: hypothetical protein VLT45_31565 [Kofleriaceae bacterium]|nr:hypothetical protein [Kofleriaceae bacterium]
MPGRILVVHYSRSGHTKQLAEQIAQTVGADLEAIVDPTDRSGLLGYLRSGYQAARQRTVGIGPAAHDPSAYDLVVIGTPIWNMSVSPPVRSYLARELGRLPRVAFFCTCGGSGGERAFAQMARVCGKPPAATLIVREAELARSGSAIARFSHDIAEAIRSVSPPAIAPQVGTPASR